MMNFLKRMLGRAALPSQENQQQSDNCAGIAEIVICNSSDDETTQGIEFSGVRFRVEGVASEQTIYAALCEEFDDLCNFSFNQDLKYGSFVTIDFTPNIGKRISLGV